MFRKSTFRFRDLSNSRLNPESPEGCDPGSSRNPAVRIRTVRARHLIWRLGCVGAISVPLFVLPAGTSFAQQIDITPATSITPSSHVTTWVFQMAIAAAVLGVLILIGLGLGYLRFAPKFYGREEQAAAVPPGTRPPTLVR